TALAGERTRLTAAEALPPLRQAEAEAGAELHRLVLAREALDQEERRVLTARGEAEQRLHQLAQDRKREDEIAADATAALGRLGEEKTGLAAAQEGEIAAQQQAGDTPRQGPGPRPSCDAGRARR